LKNSPTSAKAGAMIDAAPIPKSVMSKVFFNITESPVAPKNRILSTNSAIFSAICPPLA
jgi:hypothetical protein